MSDDEIPYDTAREEFESKAPLLEFEEMKNILIENVIHERLLDRTRGIWLHGSFVDPDSEIDTGDKRSDMDVFVVVPGWELPVATTGIAWTAPQAPQIEGLEHLRGNHDWDELPAPSEDWKWNCSPGEAWEKLPDYVRTTLVNSNKRFFFATPTDYKERKARPYDVFVGDVEQFEFHSKIGPKVKVWENDEYSTEM